SEPHLLGIAHCMTEREARTARNDAAATNITAVDCHAHVMRIDAPLAPDRHSAPKRDCTVEDYLSVLDTHGISHGVLTAPSFYGTDNRLLLEALDRADGRLRGTVIVDADIDRAALAATGQRGTVGGAAPMWSARSTRWSTRAVRSSSYGQAIGRSCRTRTRSPIAIAWTGWPTGSPTKRHGASSCPIRRQACSASIGRCRRESIN